MSKLHEMRRHPREQLSLRVRFAMGGWGVTRDISEHGVYVLLPVQRWPEPWVALDLELRRAGLRYHAHGQVLRLEPRPQATDGLILGMALRLHLPLLLSLPSLRGAQTRQS